MSQLYNSEGTELKIGRPVAEYHGVRDGGALSSAANGRSAQPTTVELLLAMDLSENGWVYGSTTAMLGINRGTGGTVNANLNSGTDYMKATLVNGYTPGQLIHVVLVYDGMAKHAYCDGELKGSNQATGAKTLDDAMAGSGVTVYCKRIWDRALTAADVRLLYNCGYPQHYDLPPSMRNGLLSELVPDGITDSSWKDGADGRDIPLAASAELIRDDPRNPFFAAATYEAEREARLSSAVKSREYPEYEVIVGVERASHDATFIDGAYVSFNKPSDGPSYWIDLETKQRIARVTVNLTESTTRELEMKSCDYKWGKLLVGNGRAIKYGETSYLEQGANLYVFHQAAGWKTAVEAVTFANCGDYDKIDLSALGYKIYGFWGQAEDMVYINCNLFNDVYLIQLGRGAENMGLGSYTQAAEGRYNGSYAVVGHWHQDGTMGEYGAHGGQAYKGHLYLAVNYADRATVMRCVLRSGGVLEFEELEFAARRPGDVTRSLYEDIDGLAIDEEGVMYAQPLYKGGNYVGTDDIIAVRL